jgi:hypothetical protein
MCAFREHRSPSAQVQIFTPSTRLRGVARLSFTARIEGTIQSSHQACLLTFTESSTYAGLTAPVERGSSEAARSGSKRLAWVLLSLLFLRARRPVWLLPSWLDNPSKLARFCPKRVAWIGPQLRTSNDHSFTVGVP